MRKLEIKEVLVGLVTDCLKGGKANLTFGKKINCSANGIAHSQDVLHIPIFFKKWKRVKGAKQEPSTGR